MPSNSHTMLAPTYYRHFRCTGSECPDSCCYGWRVDLNQQTFEKYQAIEEKVNGHRVSEVIRKNDVSTESHYGTSA
jgi:lysine-N-methylase